MVSSPSRQVFKKAAGVGGRGRSSAHGGSLLSGTWPLPAPGPAHPLPSRAEGAGKQDGDPPPVQGVALAFGKR